MNGSRIAFSNWFKECPDVAIIQARPNFFDFSFPFIAKIHRGSSMRRVFFLIHNDEELRRYLHRSPVPLFRNILFNDVSDEVLAFSEQVTRRCNFDDVGLDLCHTSEKGWMFLEANMNYGH